MGQGSMGTVVWLVAGQAWPRDAKRCQEMPRDAKRCQEMPRDAKSVFAANEFPKSPEQGQVFQQHRACLKEVPLGQALQSAVGSAAWICCMKFI